MLILHGTNQEAKNVIRNREGSCLMINGLNLQDTTIFNVYAPNRALKCARQKVVELQGGAYELAIMEGDLNISLSEMDRCNQQKTNKDIVECNSTSIGHGTIEIYVLFHLEIEKFTFL